MRSCALPQPAARRWSWSRSISASSLALASRLIVLQAGRITGEVAADQVTAAELGVMLGGGIAA